jgi:abequosyltransferase
MSIELSICIPTFNFANFLRETLESIISQLNDDIEIIIVDGGSTDGTQDIVLEYQKKYNCIQYFLRDKRVGVDLDLTKAVELASGTFCWFMSSDDKLKTGAIEKVLQEIESDCDIYLCNRTECNLKLKPIRDRFWLTKDVKNSIYELSKKDQFIAYLSRACSIGALFSYCSSIIFKREKWNNSCYNNCFIGTGYAHVYRLFSFRNSGCRLKYIKEALVLCRGGNDSFLAQGKVKRFLLDIDGYCLLAEHLFSKEPELKDAFLQVMTREIKLHYLMEICSLVRDKKEWRNIKLKLLKVGFNSGTLMLAETIGSNKIIASQLKRLKEKIKKR